MLAESCAFFPEQEVNKVNISITSDCEAAAALIPRTAQTRGKSYLQEHDQVPAGSIRGEPLGRGGSVLSAQSPVSLTSLPSGGSVGQSPARWGVMGAPSPAREGEPPAPAPPAAPPHPGEGGEENGEARVESWSGARWRLSRGSGPRSPRPRRTPRHQGESPWPLPPRTGPPFNGK